MGIEYKQAAHEGSVGESETSEMWFKSLLMRNLFEI